MVLVAFALIGARPGFGMQCRGLLKGSSGMPVQELDLQCTYQHSRRSASEPKNLLKPQATWGVGGVSETEGPPLNTRKE